MLHLLAQRPDYRGGGSRDVCHDQSLGCTTISNQPTACVEPEPANPEHPCTGHAKRQTVRLKLRGWIPLARANHDTGSQRTDARRDVNHDATGQIDRVPPVHKAIFSPNPVADRRVDQQCPKGGKQNHGRKLHPLYECTHHEGRRDDEEGHLKSENKKLRNRFTPCSAKIIGVDPLRENIFQPSPKGVPCTERDGVTADHP